MEINHDKITDQMIGLVNANHDNRARYDSGVLDRSKELVVPAARLENALRKWYAGQCKVMHRDADRSVLLAVTGAVLCWMADRGIGYAPVMLLSAVVCQIGAMCLGGRALGRWAALRQWRP